MNLVVRAARGTIPYLRRDSLIRREVLADRVPSSLLTDVAIVEGTGRREEELILEQVESIEETARVGRRSGDATQIGIDLRRVGLADVDQQLFDLVHGDLVLELSQG